MSQAKGRSRTRFDCGNLWHHPCLFLSVQGLSVCSACMGSVARNILHVPSRGTMGCVLEDNFQVCLLTSFMTQLFQRNKGFFVRGITNLKLKLKRILAQYLVLMQLLSFLSSSFVISRTCIRQLSSLIRVHPHGIQSLYILGSQISSRS